MNYSQLDLPDIQNVLFHPRRHTEPVSTTGKHTINVAADSTVTLGCRFFINDASSPTLLYFHGNGETANDYEDIAPLFVERGMNVFLATYRGYGWSSGTPSAAAMMKDSLKVYSAAVGAIQEMGLKDTLFVMGRSIGSAAAIEVCSHFSDSLRGLIVDSGFAQTLPLLESLGYDTSQSGLTEKDGFGNIEKIEEIKIPTLFLHGSQDLIIPIRQAEKLQAFSGARMKKFFVIPGADHNSVLTVGGELYFEAVKDFIDEITGATSWRQRRKQFKRQR